MQIEYNDRIINVEPRTKIKDILPDEIIETNAIAARFNNEIKSLNYEVKEDGKISLIDISNKDGIRIYRKGLIYVIGMAVEELFPNAKMIVNYQLSNSLMCEFDDMEITQEMIDRLNEKVAEIISNDYPIEKRSISKEEAQKFYEENQTEKGKLQLELEPVIKIE